MGKSRRTAVLAIAAVGALVPVGAANAVSTGDAPARHHVRHSGPSVGHIKICKRGLDTIDVYADGQGRTWQDTLDTGPVSCTTWGTMRAGMYDIGFAQNVASQEHTVILATYKDNRGRVAHKVFDGGQGVFNLLLLPGKDVKIKLHSRRVGAYDSDYDADRGGDHHRY
jgi:hypothetical protein